MTIKINVFSVQKLSGFFCYLKLRVYLITRIYSSIFKYEADRKLNQGIYDSPKIIFAG